ncbi:Sec14p-like phosphatidylinositol transfer family protein [Zostera marina]|uniref:Sec14p-like phosphatidylinositol transfer family protein n=1 Tax=Zostera marina TaxID=29655 RepID=A0A0K9PSM8_ZOSMR|nr:Sec14p-like phosphatidylinositol transfer family protein [Zostera marina]
MGRTEEEERKRIDSVMLILRKQKSLTLKQEKFCNDACVERFLRWKGDNVKKTARQIRTCLSWRDSIGAEHAMADEFAPELAEGAAYVAGYDDEARPVLVFRVKQDYPKFHSQRRFSKLVAFTLEVAISSMSRFVDQLVILFDASLFRSASAFLNLFMTTVKILSEYYPGRLHRAFVVDPPSLFPYLWKGARPFVDQWSATSVVYSLDFDTSFSDEHFSFRTSSLRFDSAAISSSTATVTPTPPVNNIIGGIANGSASSRFSFTVSHFDSLKPWYLSRTECPTCRPTNSPSLIGVSPITARSFSFASPAIRSSKTAPSTPMPHPPPRTPRPRFLPSPAAFFFGRRRQGGGGGGEHDNNNNEKDVAVGFAMYLRFYRKPYDEMAYRSKMRPPLGGIFSIVSPQILRQQRCRHVSHQRL